MENIKKHLKEWFPVFIIMILGLALRLIGLNKPGGLWFDEMESYFDSTGTFPFGILQNIFQYGAHPPLHFFYLHLWMKLFGNADIVLRLSSVLAGILLIPVAYLIGKELLSKKLGLLMALVFSVNSLCIYYSQECRFYSLFNFFIALSVLFLLKVKNNPTKTNLVGLFLANLACVYTSTLGIVFFLTEISIFALYLYFFDKKPLKQVITSQSFVLLAYAPYLLILSHQLNTVSNSVLSMFNYAKYQNECILYVIQDWISPILVNTSNYPLGYYENLLSRGIFVPLVLFIIFPTGIFLTGIINALVSKRKEVYVLLSTGLLIFLFEIFMSMLGKFAIVSRYTMITGLLAIICSCYGLLSIKNIIIRRTLIIFLVVLNLYYLILSPRSAPRLLRNEGLNYAAMAINKFNPTKNDIIIMPFGGVYLKKYDYENKFNTADFNMLKMYNGNDSQGLKRVFSEVLIKSLDKQNDYDKLKDYVGSKTIATPLNNYMKNEILDKLHKGDRLFVVLSGGVTPYTPEMLENIVQNDTVYKEQSLLFMLASKNANDILKIANLELKPVLAGHAKFWNVYVFYDKL